jgi:hypothetical protein
MSAAAASDACSPLRASSEIGAFPAAFAKPGRMPTSHEYLNEHVLAMGPNLTGRCSSQKRKNY